jgi:hypothetical protein
VASTVQSQIESHAASTVQSQLESFMASTLKSDVASAVWSENLVTLSGTSNAASVMLNTESRVWATTVTEPTAGAPSATPTAVASMGYLYGYLRNKRTQTASRIKVFNDAGTSLYSCVIGDDGTTFTKDEFGAS